MKIFIWCNKGEDIVKNPEDYSLVMKEVHAHPILGLVDEASANHRLYFNVSECRCMNQDTIIRHIGKLGILNIFPNMIENGWVYHRLIVFNHKDLEAFKAP